MIARDSLLPEGYSIEGSRLFSEERRVRVLSKREREPTGIEEEPLGPRPICSWNGQGVSADLLRHIARLDKASRHGSPAVRRDAHLELADLFRG